MEVLKKRSNVMKSKNVFAVLLGISVAFAFVPQVVAQSKAEKKAEKQAEKKAGKEGEEKKGNSGKQHGAKSDTGPVVVNWTIEQKAIQFKDSKQPPIKFGTGNLTLNSDGTWNFSGQMNQLLTGCEFSAVLGIKNSEGVAIAFKQSAALEKEKPQSFSWEKQGKNPTIKDNFKAFKKDHDWYGSWNCVGLPKPGSSGGGGGGPDAGTVVSDVVGVLGALLAIF
jgi:hypothetical protein